MAAFSAEGGFTEDAAQKLLDWASRTALDYTILELALDGEVVIGWDNESGQPAVRTATKKEKLYMQKSFDAVDRAFIEDEEARTDAKEHGEAES